LIFVGRNKIDDPLWLRDFLQRFLGESRLLCEEQMKSKNDTELVDWQGLEIGMHMAN